jgi:hypothetical protein
MHKTSSTYSRKGDLTARTTNISDKKADRVKKEN